MSTSQSRISEAVRLWMDQTRTSQTRLGALLEVSQGAISRKLATERPWTLDDLDALIAAGVPIGLAVYGDLAMSTPEVVR